MRFTRTTLPVSRRARILLAALGVIAATGPTACHDFPTAPQYISPPPRPSHDFISEDDYGKRNSPQSGTYSGAIDSIFGNAPTKSNATGYFTYGTIIEVRSSGRVKEVRGVGPFYGRSWGPVGWSNAGVRDAAMGLALTSPLGGTTWWVSTTPADAATTVDTIKVNSGISIYGQRSEAVSNVDPGDVSHCGPHGYAPCNYWSGAASLWFTRLPVSLVASPLITRIVPRDTIVTFSVRANPEVIHGSTVDLSDVRWRWVSSGIETDTTTCQASTATTCSRRLVAGGMMIVTAYANGEQQQRTLNVDVDATIHCYEIQEMRDSFPALTDPRVDSALKKLWLDSKYSTDTLDGSRRELSGYIVRNVDSTYSFVPTVYSNSVRHGACWTDSDPPPPNAVYPVHTHPIKENDSVSSCAGTPPPDDPKGTRYRTHDNGWQRAGRGASGDSVSGDYGDLQYMQDNNHVSLRGLILDPDGIISYDLSDRGTSTNSGHFHPRCNY